MSRHLVTTALEASWKPDAPTLFLGEWCRRFGRSPVWSEMDAVVAPAFGVVPNEKRRNVACVEELASRLLGELVPVLNDYHGTTHGVRYWLIVLGHWLQRYVGVAYFRYVCVSRAIDGFPLAGTTFLQPSGYSLVTTDSLTFIWATNDDLWNHVFFSRVIQSINKVDWDAEVVPTKGPTNFSVDDDPQPTQGFLNSIRRLVFDSILPAMGRQTDAFVLNSYLPSSGELLLQLALWQVPQRWRTPKLSPLPVPNTRQRIPNWHPVGHTGFEQFVRELLPEVIPVCFLEGYKAIAASKEIAKWPHHPKFVFTSNNFDTDETFKIWAAGKAEAGTPYFTGQHGNNYGTHFFFGDHSYPERTAADRFLTWGWDDGRPTTLPAFNFKIDLRNAAELDSLGGVLLIETSAMHKIMPWDVDAEHSEYMEQQFRFTDALPAEIRKSMVVRLHAGSARLRHEEPARWAVRFRDLPVDNGATPLRKLVSRSRLVVHSYDSTGVLEMLAANQPFICFWPNGLEHLEDSAVPYYQLLVAAGILQLTPEAAASKVASIWTDVSGWWRSSEVERARLQFCERYSVVEKQPVAVLRTILVKNAEEVKGDRSG